MALEAHQGEEQLKEDNECGCLGVTWKKGCGKALVVLSVFFKNICFSAGDGFRRSFGMISSIVISL